jgi:hypothetical protein
VSLTKAEAVRLGCCGPRVFRDSFVCEFIKKIAIVIEQ